jgi:hypothetical protein
VARGFREVVYTSYIIHCLQVRVRKIKYRETNYTLLTGVRPKNTLPTGARPKNTLPTTGARPKNTLPTGARPKNTLPTYRSPSEKYTASRCPSEKYTAYRCQSDKLSTEKRKRPSISTLQQKRPYRTLIHNSPIKCVEAGLHRSVHFRTDLYVPFPACRVDHYPRTVDKKPRTVECTHVPKQPRWADRPRIQPL